MNKNRLEAFSDGVIAIIITIMVLELKVPHSSTFSSLYELAPILLSYVLSFVYVGIYWNNHHHMLHVVQKVNGATLWANMHLLFWLSLIPFSTAWMGENHFAEAPLMLYGANLLMCAIAYSVLVLVLLKNHDKHSKLAQAIGNDFKGRISLIFYVVGIAVTPMSTALGALCYILVAGIWLVPDRRIEKTIAHTE